MDLICFMCYLLFVLNFVPSTPDAKQEILFSDGAFFNYYSECFHCDQDNPPLHHDSSWQLFFVAVPQKASGNHAPCKGLFQEAQNTYLQQVLTECFEVTSTPQAISKVLTMCL